VQHDVEQEFLEFDNLYPDAEASFPPSIRVKSRVVRGTNHDPCLVSCHCAVEHSPQSSRVVPRRHKHNGSELMLFAPCWKHLALIFGSADCGNFYDIH
jgi:hypothetical protein